MLFALTLAVAPLINAVPEVVVVAKESTAQVPAIAQGKSGVAVVGYGWPKNDITIQLLDENLVPRMPAKKVGEGTMAVVAAANDGFFVVYGGVGLQLVRVSAAGVVDKPIGVDDASGAPAHVVFNDDAGRGLVVHDIVEGVAVVVINGRGVAVKRTVIHGRLGASQPVRVKSGWRFVTVDDIVGKHGVAGDGLVIVDVSDAGIVRGTYAVAATAPTEPWLACRDADGLCAVVSRPSALTAEVNVVIVEMSSDGRGKEIARAKLTGALPDRVATMPRVVVDGRGWRVLWIASSPGTWSGRIMTTLVDDRGTADVAMPMSDASPAGWWGVSIGKQRLLTAMGSDPNVPHPIIVVRF